MDKLIGALATAGHDPAEGFILSTARCSYEIVEKARPRRRRRGWSPFRCRTHHGGRASEAVGPQPVVAGARRTA
jgi:hypothetical protein